MALTSSTMLPLGTQAPAFSLTDVVSGKSISLDTFTGRPALLVMFICTHCPYVRHVQNELAKLGAGQEKHTVILKRVEQFMEFRLGALEKHVADCNLKTRVAKLESASRLIRWAAVIIFGSFLTLTTKEVWPSICRLFA